MVFTMTVRVLDTETCLFRPGVMAPETGATVTVKFTAWPAIAGF